MKKSGILLSLAAALCSLLIPTQPVLAQGTAFTYQGFLTDQGAPANASYDLRFTIYADASSGTVVAGPVDVGDAGVTNGLFTLTLDFGANVFNGNDRWLEIGVRPGTSTGAYSMVAPLQKITATPYALLAGKLSGTVASSGLGGTYGNVVTFSNAANVFNGTFVGNGGGLSNLNAASLGGVSASNFWKLGGNAGTTAGANFLGTADSQPLEFKVNGLRALRLEPTAEDATHSGLVNVVGGSPANFVGAGVFGATIAGGGTAYYFGGFYSNIVTALFGTVGGGLGNASLGYSATVGGGSGNTSSGANATVGGGRDNTSIGVYATVGGGFGNTGSGYSATVGGGNANVSSGNYATVGGGNANFSSGESATVGGGDQNFSYGDTSTVGGGSHNTSQNINATVGGGYGNSSRGGYSTVGGGQENYCSGIATTVGGGYQNTSSGHKSTVGGGGGNTSSGLSATVGGGDVNTSTGDYATVGGGILNTSSGTYATVGGGYGNTAGGLYSFAAGYRAKANHDGSFVWAIRDIPAPSLAASRFHINAYNGLSVEYDVQLPNGAGARSIVIGVTGGQDAIYAWNGARLSNGGAWVNGSDRNRKDGFAEVNPREILDKLAALPIQTWHYTNETAEIRHLGPMAQDFRAAFGLGYGDKSIATVDADGVALAAIQGLNQKVEEQGHQQTLRSGKLEAENAELKQKNVELESRLGALEKLLNRLAVAKGGEQ